MRATILTVVTILVLVSNTWGMEMYLLKSLSKTIGQQLDIDKDIKSMLASNTWSNDQIIHLNKLAKKSLNLAKQSLQTCEHTRYSPEDWHSCSLLTSSVMSTAAEASFAVAQCAITLGNKEEAKKQLNYVISTFNDDVRSSAVVERAETELSKFK